MNTPLAQISPTRPASGTHARLRKAILTGLTLWGATWSQGLAESITVPAYSFESPPIALFLDPETHLPPIALPYDGLEIYFAPWQVTQDAPGFQIGVFPNPPANSPNGDHIDNATGDQNLFIYAGINNTIFQDLSTPGATFDIGKYYVLRIDAGGNAGLPLDAHMNLRFYYRNELNQKVTVASSSTLFDAGLDPYPINHLYEYSVTTLTVQAGDAWAGKAIGIEIATPANPAQINAGSYWDVDNVRVDSVPEPASLGLCALGLASLALTRPRRRRSS